MIKQSIEVIKGQLIWSALKLKEHLDYKKVVLVLAGENKAVDECALKYLDQVIERKCAEQALVIVLNKTMAGMVLRRTYNHKVKVKIMPAGQIELIYKWHCLDKFYRNLIFTYVRTNQDNLLERFINETDINEEDAVCLALYNLRTIPRKGIGASYV